MDGVLVFLCFLSASCCWLLGCCFAILPSRFCAFVWVPVVWLPAALSFVFSVFLGVAGRWFFFVFAAVVLAGFLLGFCVCFSGALGFLFLFFGSALLFGWPRLWGCFAGVLVPFG